MSKSDSSKKKKVFLAWHGERSHKIADVLYNWLPTVNSTIDPFYSTESIGIADEWFQQIIDNLKKSDFGIFCITPENKNSSWMFFEAGGLKLTIKPIAAFLTDLSPIDIAETPLGPFQAIIFQKDSIRKLVNSLSLNDNKDIVDEEVETKFETEWPKLKKNILNIPPSILHEKIEEFSLNTNQIKACGIRNIFKIKSENHLRNKRVDQVIETELQNGPEEANFRLLASSGFSYINPMGKVWSNLLGKAVNKGAKFTIIIESPYSSFATSRALVNRMERTHWSEKVNIEHLTQITEKEDSSVEIYVTDQTVLCSLFFTTESVFYDPYLWFLPFKGGRSENNFCVFEYSSESSCNLCEYNASCISGDGVYLNYYNALSRHFDFLKKTSVKLEDFLKNKNGKQDSKFLRKLQKLRSEFPNFEI